MSVSSGIESQAGTELRLLLAVTRRLPRVRGAGRISGVFRRIYSRKRRHDTIVDVLGFKMLLDPGDSLEGQLLFSPHLYDRKEIAYLREHLKSGDIFVDAGANVGFYSLITSQLVGSAGTVLAVEADPNNASRLKANLQLNQINNVRLVNAGLSDEEEMLRLGLNTSGNRSGHSFLYDGPDSVDVECRTLLGMLVAEGIRSVRGAKFDIEGFEFRVLHRFFQDAPRELWPNFMIIEDNSFFAGKTGGDTLALLKEQGYRLARIDELNYLATR